jgi:hypothetical protein
LRTRCTAPQPCRRAPRAGLAPALTTATAYDRAAAAAEPPFEEARQISRFCWISSGRAPAEQLWLDAATPTCASVTCLHSCRPTPCRRAFLWPLPSPCPICLP